MSEISNSLGTIDVRAITPKVFAKGPEKIIKGIIPVRVKEPPKRVRL